MILLPLALDSITGDTGVSIGLVLAAGGGIGGIIIGAAVLRALHGEMLRRHDERIKKLEGIVETAPPAVNADKIKEIETWKQEATRQLQEFEIHRAVQEERSSGGSTTRGSRPKTGPRKPVDR
jgi:hypothetical protein